MSHGKVVGRALLVAVAALLVWAVPELLVRLLLWLPTRMLLRLRAGDVGALGERSSAVLIAAHGAPFEAVLLGAVCPRPCRLVVPPGWLARPVLGFVLRRQAAIANDAAEAPIEAVTQALAHGELVCVLGASEPWLEAVVEKTGVSVLPLGWRGRRFVRPGASRDRSVLRELARHLGARLEGVLGPAIGADAFSAARLEQELRALGKPTGD
jgi:hypothetical protein